WLLTLHSLEQGLSVQRVLTRLAILAFLLQLSIARYQQAEQVVTAKVTSWFQIKVLVHSLTWRGTQLLSGRINRIRWLKSSGRNFLRLSLNLKGASSLRRRKQGRSH